jgi:glycyl-tRNA synthetase beta chain
MVGEFPELQGVMGRYYALNDGEDPRVADAIADHYKPQGPNDTCPTAPASVIVALADKLDSLAAFFAIDEKPTGSRDPFALRRAALGAIRLILDNRLRLSLVAAFARAGHEIGPQYDPGATTAELLAFVADRLKVHLREQGVRHDLIAAVFAHVGAAGMLYAARYEDDLVRLLARVAALHHFLGTDDGANLLIAYKRASNIVAIEDRKDGFARNIDADPGLLRNPEEKILFQRLDEVIELTRSTIQREDFAASMAALATLRRPVDEFFEKVTVNAPEPELRENRLRLLSRIRAVMNQIADFSQIEG